MQILAQSHTVAKVPYAHVGYLAAASHRSAGHPEVASAGVSVTLLVVAGLSLVTAFAAGLGGARGAARRRRGLLALALGAVLLGTLAAAAFAFIETRDRQAMVQYRHDLDERKLMHTPSAEPPAPDMEPPGPAGSESEPVSSLPATTEPDPPPKPAGESP